MEMQAHRNAEALSVFKEIIHIDLSNSNAYNNIAYILSGSDDIHFRDLKNATIYAVKAISLNPKNPNFIDTRLLLE